MKTIANFLIALLVLALFSLPTSQRLGTAAELSELVWLEAESFAESGGWLVDQQFMDLMGSPFLLAHGLGQPVLNATTQIDFPSPGSYRVWVRTRDWVAPWHAPGSPGRFQLLVNGKPLDTTFGTEGNAWHWQDGGVVKVGESASVGLHDLTGFEGRCDVILFAKDGDFVPPDDRSQLAALRAAKLGWTNQPTDGGEYDLVVVGGGLAGTAAAISAARLGLTVALVQDRPVLGGNASSEVRVWPEGETNLPPYPRIGDVVSELVPPRGPGAGNAAEAKIYDDARKLKLASDEPNLTLLLEQRVNDAVEEQGVVKSVIAQHTRSGKRTQVRGHWFLDATGDGVLGALVGADFQITETGHLGTSNLWNVGAVEKNEHQLKCLCEEDDPLSLNFTPSIEPAPFPRCPWAVDLSERDFPGRGSWRDRERLEQEPEPVGAKLRVALAGRVAERPRQIEIAQVKISALLREQRPTIAQDGRLLMVGGIAEGFAMRGLVTIDLSLLSEQATLLDAAVELFSEGPRYRSNEGRLNATTITLAEVIGAKVTADATWSSGDNRKPWQTPGGDAGPVLAEQVIRLDTKPLANRPAVRFQSPALTAAIQAALRRGADEITFILSAPEAESLAKQKSERNFAIFGPFSKAGQPNLRNLGGWFWESGFDKDPILDMEQVRDQNLRAMYGAWDTLKNVDGRFPNHRLKWAAYIAGKRESRRLLGDVILTGDNFRQQTPFPDAAFPCTWDLDLHLADTKYEGGDDPFISSAKFGKYAGPYWAPYRCLYSRNIDNLFMAGRDISVTHEALGAVRVMRTCGMMGEVVGMAAAICKQHHCQPRDVFQTYLSELQEGLKQGAGKQAVTSGQGSR